MWQRAAGIPSSDITAAVIGLILPSWLLLLACVEKLCRSGPLELLADVVLPLSSPFQLERFLDTEVLLRR